MGFLLSIIYIFLSFADFSNSSYAINLVSLGSDQLREIAWSSLSSIAIKFETEDHSLFHRYIEAIWGLFIFIPILPSFYPFILLLVNIA